MFDFFRTFHTSSAHFVLNSAANSLSFAWLAASCFKGRVALSMLGVEKMSAVAMRGSLHWVRWDVAGGRQPPWKTVSLRGASRRLRWRGWGSSGGGRRETDRSPDRRW